MAKKRKLVLPEVTPESLKKAVWSCLDRYGEVRSGCDYKKKLLPYAIVLSVLFSVDPCHKDKGKLLNIFEAVGIRESHALRQWGAVLYALAVDRAKKDFTSDNLIDATVEELRKRKIVWRK